MTSVTTRARAAGPAERPTRRRPDLGGFVPWVVAALLATAVLVPLGILSPQVCVLVVGGVAAAYTAFRWPFVIAITALASIVGSSVVEAVLGSAGSSLDEALTVLCLVAFTLRRIWLDRAIVFPGGTFWFAAFFVVGVYSSLINTVPASIWSQQAFLSLKGFLLAFSFAQIDWTTRRIRALVVGGVVVSVIFIITAGINIAAPAAWLKFTGARIASQIGSIPALSGIYPHPAALGRMCAVIGLGALVYLLVVRRGWWPGLFLAAATAIGFATVRVKTLTSMIIVYTLFATRARSKWLTLFVIALAPLVLVTFVPAFYLLVSDDLTSYFFGTKESARGLLIGGAFEIAAASFPFGAGFGRYGSYVASVNYSPEYVERGWTRYYGLGEGTEWGRFLTDTQWPAFLGETGWLGTVLFAAGLIAMVIYMARRISPIEPVLYTWIRWCGIGWILMITIESIGAPVFTSPPAYPFAFIGVGIVASLRYQHKKKGLIPLEEFSPAGELSAKAALR